MPNIDMREQYSEKKWLKGLFGKSDSGRTVVVAKTSLKTFDFFCKHQNLTREQMIEKYLTWFKPNKIDGERPDPDIRSICISLSKFVEFMNENHRDIVTSVNVETGKETTFKKKSPKSIKLYFGFVKSYLRKCHEIKISVEDFKDYVIFPKKRKITRQPISLEQLKQIMNEANPKRRALYYVLVSSGMRLGEALTLTKRNFNFTETPVRVDIEAENTKTKEDRSTYISSEAVKLAITPMISSLSILNYVDMNSESEVLGYGISLIILNLGMYLGVPAIVVIGIKKRSSQ